jgi:Protein of unknown function (DUF2975)
MKRSRPSPILSFLKVVLDVTWYLMAIGLALGVCLLLLSAFNHEPGSMQLGIPVSFESDLQASSVASPSVRIDGVRIKDARGTLNIPIEGGEFLFANVAILITLMTFGLFVFTQLRAVFRTLRAGQPFVSANVRRIRWIGVAVIVGELAWSGIVLFENRYAATHFTAAGIRFNTMPAVNAVAIIYGLIILAIAEVFREGTRLEEDQSLTV